MIIVCGLWAELFARARLMVPGDAVTTADRILAMPGLLRGAILADLVMVACDVGLALAIYALFAPRAPGLARVAAAFRLMQAAVLAANLLNLWAALLLAAEAPSLALAFMNLHAAGYDMGLVFFGLHCLLLAILIARTQLLPRAFVPLVAAAGLVYLAGSFARLLAPGLMQLIAPAYAVPLVAEIGLCLWLLAGRVTPAHRPVNPPPS